jgi:pentatricopeptide repeat protein
MIVACTRDGLPEEALDFFHRMSRTGLQPNHFTFSTVLPACANSTSLWKGVEIHTKIIKSGFESDLVVANALIDMYAKCGSIENARELFEKMLQQDVVSWTTLIAGYAHNGFLDVAMKLFKEMLERNVVSSNAMITGFSQNGYGEKALELFGQMQLAGLKPEEKTFVSVLPGCADMAALDYGMEIHEKVLSSGFQSDVVVLNSLIDMYVKCGCIQKAHALFDRMHGKDSVSWNTMIT